MTLLQIAHRNFISIFNFTSDTFFSTFSETSSIETNKRQEKVQSYHFYYTTARLYSVVAPILSLNN